MGNKLGITVVCMTILLLWIASGVTIYFAFDDWGDRGTFGDMFGAINALFSGLALAGVVYAIVLQQRELSLQYKELKRTASAQENSEKALREQVRIQIQSAKLNALSTVLSHLNNESLQASGLQKESLRSSATDVLSRIQKLLDEEDPK